MTRARHHLRHHDILERQPIEVDSKMKLSQRWLVLTIACFAAFGQTATAVDFGNMQADRILFLGNSITLHGPYPGWSNVGGWGLAASEKSKDYVHLLSSKIDAATGGSLTLTPEPVDTPSWSYDNALPNYSGNILNVADIFERNYNTWENARIQNQLDWKANLVVLQFGENMANGTLTQFKAALEDLMDGLQASSNPNIFVTSFIIGSNSDVDAIKKEVCAEDSSHRVFVNLSGLVDCSGVAGHPNNAGMQTIANALFGAMKSHSTVPEPCSWTLLASAVATLAAYAWRKRG
jgi:hypothetical protein